MIEKASIDEVYIDVTAEVERALSRHEAHGGLLPEADSVVIGGPLNPGSEFERRLGQGAGLAARLRAALFEQLGELRVWTRRPRGDWHWRCHHEVAVQIPLSHQQAMITPGHPLHRLHQLGWHRQQQAAGQGGICHEQAQPPDHRPAPRRAVPDAGVTGGLGAI